MTRETKVGLVVAGSFVCLVSVVVASRLHPKPDDTPTEEKIAQGPAAKSDTPMLPNNEGKAIAPGAKTNPPGIIPAGLTTSVPPPLSPQSPPTLPQTPAQADAGPALVKKDKTQKAPDLGADAAAEAEHQRIKDGLENLVTKKSKSTEAPILPGQSLEDTPREVAANAPKTPPPTLPAASSLAMDGNGLPVPTVVKAAEPLAPPLPAVDKTVAKKKEPAMAPVVPPPVAPPPIVASPAIPPPQVVQPMPIQVADLTPKASASNVFKEVTNPNLPAMGAKQTFNTGQPFVSPTSANAPKVTSVTVQSYVCQPQDTTFEAVSNRNFGSPKYARALLQYNRNHPSVTADLRQDNPRLLAGQTVYIPPRNFLEDRFGEFIDNRVITPVAAAAPAVSISAPLNANAPSIPAAVSTIGRVPTPTIPTKDDTKPYRVAGDGQMLIEIAQQTLGDRGRWSEIYRLNPTIRPEYPVPGGTEIRLPSNASVP